MPYKRNKTGYCLDFPWQKTMPFSLGNTASQKSHGNLSRSVNSTYCQKWNAHLWASLPFKLSFQYITSLSSCVFEYFCHEDRCFAVPHKKPVLTNLNCPSLWRIPEIQGGRTDPGKLVRLRGFLRLWLAIHHSFPLPRVVVLSPSHTASSITWCPLCIFTSSRPALRKGAPKFIRK